MQINLYSRVGFICITLEALLCQVTLLVFEEISIKMGQQLFSYILGKCEHINSFAQIVISLWEIFHFRKKKSKLLRCSILLFSKHHGCLDIFPLGFWNNFSLCVILSRFQLHMQFSPFLSHFAFLSAVTLSTFVCLEMFPLQQCNSSRDFVK